MARKKKEPTISSDAELATVQAELIEPARTQAEALLAQVATADIEQEPVR
jgi:hypothetical protein